MIKNAYKGGCSDLSLGDEFIPALECRQLYLHVPCKPYAVTFVSAVSLFVAPLLSVSLDPAVVVRAFSFCIFLV